MQNYTERERCSEDGCNNIRRKRGTKCTRHCQSKETFEAKRVRYRKSVGRGHVAFKKSYCENQECEWSGPYTPMMLEVDHIDGDSQNNDPKNLQTFCANCHRIKTEQKKDFLARAFRGLDVFTTV